MVHNVALLEVKLNDVLVNLVSRLSHLPALPEGERAKIEREEGGKMRDPGNEVASWNLYCTFFGSQKVRCSFLFSLLQKCLLYFENLSHKNVDFFSRTKSNTWVLARQRSKLNFQVKLVYSGLGNYSSLFFSPFHTMLNKKDKNGFFFLHGENASLQNIWNVLQSTLRQSVRDIAEKFRFQNVVRPH